MSMIIEVVHLVARILTLLVIIDAFLSFFMSPYHPVRQTLDRIVEPMTAPIRRLVPPIGSIDFSPVILIILIQILEYVITSLLVSIG